MIDSICSQGLKGIVHPKIYISSPFLLTTVLMEAFSPFWRFAEGKNSTEWMPIVAMCSKNAKRKTEHVSIPLLWCHPSEIEMATF